MYAMDSVPAFKMEKFVTCAKDSNRQFIFCPVRIFLDLRNIYGMLKQSTSFMEDIVKPMIENEPDQFKRSFIIFNYIKYYYTWNEYYGIYLGLQIKETYKKVRKQALARSTFN